jgi:phenylacetate-CoA ligase
MNIVRNIRRRSHIAHFYATHRRSLRAIQRWQASHLRSLAAHCGKNVPFYKTLLAESGVRAEDIRSIDDIARLPLLTKDSFRKRPAEEYLDNSRPLFGSWGKTSGTTGKPFTFLAGDNFSNFARFRFLLWRGTGLREIATVKFVHIKTTTPVPHPNKLNISGHELMADPERAFAAVEEFDPEIIESVPSLLLEFAKKLKIHGTHRRIEPRYVVVFGEMLTPPVRRFLEETLGAEVYDRYGIDETGVIGVECALHNGFHTNGESIIVEILDDAGNPTSEGTYGRVFVTDLNNYSMPFIRYDTGDYGILRRSPCACGLETPRVWIKGRWRANLTFGSRCVNHAEFSFLLTDFMDEILRYQIAKLSDDHMSIRIVPTRPIATETHRKILEKIASITGDNVQVEVREVADIPIMPSGKTQVIVDESNMKK